MAFSVYCRRKKYSDDIYRGPIKPFRFDEVDDSNFTTSTSVKSEDKPTIIDFEEIKNNIYMKCVDIDGTVKSKKRFKYTPFKQ